MNFEKVGANHSDHVRSTNWKGDRPERWKRTSGGDVDGHPKKNAGSNQCVRRVICFCEGVHRQQIMLHTFTDSIAQTFLDFAKVLARSADLCFGKIWKTTSQRGVNNVKQINHFV